MGLFHLVDQSNQRDIHWCCSLWLFAGQIVKLRSSGLQWSSIVFSEKHCTSGEVDLSCWNTSSIIAKTVSLTWEHYLKTWTKLSICMVLSFLLIATVMCQLMPRFPNQSFWDSRYFFSKNFIAQSRTSGADVGFRLSRTSNRAWSWFEERKDMGLPHANFLHWLLTLELHLVFFSTIIDLS